jgi:hypothetical protein
MGRRRSDVYEGSCLLPGSSSGPTRAPPRPSSGSTTRPAGSTLRWPGRTSMTDSLGGCCTRRNTRGWTELCCSCCAHGPDRTAPSGLSGSFCAARGRAHSCRISRCNPPARRGDVGRSWRGSPAEEAAPHQGAPPPLRQPFRVRWRQHHYLTVHALHSIC